MFQKYNPMTSDMFRVMDNEGGVITPEYFPDLSDEQCLDAFRLMLKARTADLAVVSYQRQGRIYTYPPSYGQEAIATAMGTVMRKNDWLVPAFREVAAYLAKGATLQEMFLYYMGHEKGSRFEQAHHMLPFSVPIASQLLHATGIGYQIKYRQKDEVVFAVVGDGGTSEGDFHEALNFAGVWQVPVVFIIQNNQYGISTPVSLQTASRNLAVKSVAYGMQGIQVDGNDYFAMVAALLASVASIQRGEGPVLIEAVTYRRGAHTTSDDPSKYRTQEEEQEWAHRDPLHRLFLYLNQRNLMTEAAQESLRLQYKEEVNREFIAAEDAKAYPLEEVFDSMYDEMPPDLLLQREEHIKFLRWKEGKPWEK